jgi:acetolactate synthase-1/2/3 large subunit
VLSGAEIMIQVIADEGVETIFGYSGGAILPTYDAVFRYNQEQAAANGRPIPLIVPANEQGAGSWPRATPGRAARSASAS